MWRAQCCKSFLKLAEDFASRSRCQSAPNSVIDFVADKSNRAVSQQDMDPADVLTASRSPAVSCIQFSRIGIESDSQAIRCIAFRCRLVIIKRASELAVHPGESTIVTDIPPRRPGTGAV